jgi:hypothetical protein
MGLSNRIARLCLPGLDYTHLDLQLSNPHPYRVQLRTELVYRRGVPAGLALEHFNV